MFWSRQWAKWNSLHVRKPILMNLTLIRGLLTASKLLYLTFKCAWHGYADGANGIAGTVTPKVTEEAAVDVLTTRRQNVDYSLTGSLAGAPCQCRLVYLYGSKNSCMVAIIM